MNLESIWNFVFSKCETKGHKWGGWGPDTVHDMHVLLLKPKAEIILRRTCGRCGTIDIKCGHVEDLGLTPQDMV